MTLKYLSRLALAVGLSFSISTSTARAQPGASGMPDLSDFAGAIAKSAEAPPKKAAASTGVFKSGLPVPSVKPGEAARGVGRQFREAGVKAGGPEAALKQLEDALPQVLVALEAAFEKNGFAKRDMGVAYAYAVLDLYETANKVTVPEKPSAVAVRTLATAVAKHWGPRYLKLAPAAKEKMYESIIIATSLNTLLAQQFDQAGKTDEADQMRAVSGQLFETLMGVPAAQMKISADGRISGLSEAAAE